MSLSIIRQLKIFVHSLFLQASWSFSGMQTLGFMTTFMSGITNRAQKEILLKEHKDLFNTHPYIASYIIGAMVRLIEDKKLNITQIKRFKGIAQGTLATTGDLFFWRTLRPMFSIFAILLTIKFGIIGPVFFIISYNLYHLYHRFNGIRIGYSMGRDVVDIVNTKKFAVVQKIFEISGLVLSGFFIATLPYAQISLSSAIVILALFIVSIYWLYTKKPYGYLLSIVIALLLILNFIRLKL